jgi:hypothetical protein
VDQNDTKIVKALVDAFPTRADFVRFLDHRCEVHLDAVASNAGIEQQYSEILRSFDAKGHRPHLLWRAWFDNPGNPRLTGAIWRAFDVLPEVTVDALRALQVIVEDEDGVSDRVCEIRDAFFRANRLEWAHLLLVHNCPGPVYPELLGALASKRLGGNAIGLFELVRALARDLEGEDPGSSAAKKLGDWLSRSAPAAPMAAAVGPATSAHPALMIKLWEAAQDVFSLTAWQSIHGETRPVVLEEIRVRGLSFGSVGRAELPRAVQVLCLWFRDLVRKSRLEIGDITVEFILPLELIDRLDVEEWPFTAPGPPRRWSDLHRFCVRPYERLFIDPDDLYGNDYSAWVDVWQTRWDKFSEKKKLHPVVVDAEAPADVDASPHVDDATCALLRLGKGGRAGLAGIEACVSRGFGVVLWLRGTGLDGPAQEKELEPLVDAGWRLLDKALDLRKTSERHRHLVVLWDDPDPARRPPVLGDISVDA